ncbi:sodium:solute symporter family protein [Leptospira levettii]|uniref:Na+:solute symporter n=1 Tax=Leptospira levettii TaxID=2023178 RepID=A0AAW5V7G8_9LEPT|nr:sodium:solute symporter family protein [Leptospira levettii]MCW7466508.1 Na+:solute symporter [Leptospira levettii]MCW7511926.1 Na+:solute symporter [Leptospira levettii]MCW7515686.1 Na+:solute symporter [Leptospira levettii]TGL66929.1 sodium:proline symporter [Leptospira levettii]TGM28195.1 sodium:proline symporter [Leptospira levettii]
MNSFHILDYFFFLFPFFIIFFILYRFRAKNNSTKEYFQAEGSLNWFVAGTAMVATTFAADTPLAVTEIIRTQGISGNWIWWYMAVGGFVTVFFFSKLWKRSGASTDLELIQIRYSGKEAEFLRGFKAFVIGLLLNLVILGWVNLAMLKIIPVFFPNTNASLVLVFLLLFGVIYTAIAGLRGISYIDVFQFFLAWIGCILFAYFALQLPSIGGLENLKSQLPKDKILFFPNGDHGSLPWDHFLILLTVLWWSSWYPGSEPGGGGYIAQRILATKNESAALKGSLWFVIAHYFVRPWPWILVALVSIVLYPNLSEVESGKGFLMVLQEGMPNGMRGLMLSAFLAAYLSTLATHLNWGASYLVNDLWKPFTKGQKSDSYFVKVSYLIQLLTAVFSFFLAVYGMETIKGAWVFLLEASSGIGFVLIVRWYFWRISAWTEILALILSPILYIVYSHLLNSPFPYSILYTAISSAIILLFSTYVLPHSKKETLYSFYETTRPPYFFWRGFFRNNPEFKQKEYPNHIIVSLVGTIFGLSFVFGGLYTIQCLFWKEGEIKFGILFFLIGLIGLIYSLQKLQSKSKP